MVQVVRSELWSGIIDGLPPSATDLGNGKAAVEANGFGYVGAEVQLTYVWFLNFPYAKQREIRPIANPP